MDVVQLLDRILDPVVEAFSPEVARRILALKADDELQGRIDELATKSNKGELTDDERAEYKNYIDVIDLISLLQAKSQRLLDVTAE